MVEETVRATLPQDDAALAAALEGIIADPSGWIDPKITFPGKVLVSRYRLASDKYREANTYRPAITEPLPQWDVQVERLDAVVVELDGSQRPPIYYGGYDLKKADRQTGKLMPLTKRNAKEQFIATSWSSQATKMGTRMADPTVFEGKFFMFDFYRAKSFGGPVPAKNVLIPIQLLAADYSFVGEKTIMEARQPVGETAAGETTTAPSTPQLGIDEAKQRVVDEFLIGRNLSTPGSVSKLIGDLPGELRLPAITTGLALGSLVEELKQTGVITVGTDGVIARV